MSLKTYKPTRARPAHRVEQSLAPGSGTATAPTVFEITEGDTPIATLHVERASESLGLLIELLGRMESISVTPVAASAAPRAALCIPTSTAQTALDGLRKRLARRVAAAHDAPAATEVSEAIKHEWVADGLLVGSSDLGTAWGGRSRQALEQAAERGDLFSLKLRGRRWYPAVFAALSAESVKAVCQPMKAVDPVAQFLFWNRPHGALAGQTVAQAIQAGQLARAVQLAQAQAQDLAVDAAAA